MSQDGGLHSDLSHVRYILRHHDVLHIIYHSLAQWDDNNLSVCFISGSVLRYGNSDRHFRQNLPLPVRCVGVSCACTPVVTVTCCTRCGPSAGPGWRRGSGATRDCPPGTSGSSWRPPRAPGASCSTSPSMTSTLGNVRKVRGCLS